MKNLRQLCAATFLMLVITASVPAGDMQTTGIITPPAQQTSTTGDIQAPGTTATGQMDTPSILDAYPATEIATTLMLNVMSIF